MDMGFHIRLVALLFPSLELSNSFSSLNGCGLKTDANLQTAKSIPPDRLLLETDAPWCSMTSTHASKIHLDTLPPVLRALYFPPTTKPEQFVYGKPVKGRNEPTAVGGVAWVMHRLNEVPFESVAEKVWKNTVELFGLEELR